MSFGQILYAFGEDYLKNYVQPNRPYTTLVVRFFRFFSTQKYNFRCIDKYSMVYYYYSLFNSNEEKSKNQRIKVINASYRIFKKARGRYREFIAGNVPGFVRGPVRQPDIKIKSY